MRTPGRRLDGGFSLIEVLVAVLVLGLGVLGVISMQIHALRNVKVSGDSQAVSVHVNELVEMMRLNAENAADYDGLTTAACAAPANRAQSDFCDVWTRLSNHLSNATTSLVVTSCPGDGTACTVSAQWTPKATYGSTDAAQQRSLVVSVLL